jgi:hypothetical protein
LGVFIEAPWKRFKSVAIERGQKKTAVVSAVGSGFSALFAIKPLDRH